MAGRSRGVDEVSTFALGATTSRVEKPDGLCETEAEASAVEGIVVGAARFTPVSSIRGLGSFETGTAAAMACVVGPERAVVKVGSSPAALATRGRVPFAAGSGPLEDSEAATGVALTCAVFEPNSA